MEDQYGRMTRWPIRLKQTGGSTRTGLANGRLGIATLRATGTTVHLENL